MASFDYYLPKKKWSNETKINTVFSKTVNYIDCISVSFFVLFNEKKFLLKMFFCFQ